MSPPAPPPTPPLRWPKIALFCAVLFVVTCVFFMLKEVKRIKRIREATTEMRGSTPQTSAPPEVPAKAPANKSAPE